MLTICSRSYCSGGSDIESALRNARIAEALYKEYPVEAYYCRVVAMTSGAAFTWLKPVEENTAKLRRAFHIGMSSGDTEIALVCSTGCRPSMVSCANTYTL